MTQDAFSRRVTELHDAGMPLAAAIGQTAWEEDHGRTEIDVPVVVAGAVA